jgi:hypothetical protein
MVKSSVPIPPSVLMPNGMKPVGPGALKKKFTSETPCAMSSASQLSGAGPMGEKKYPGLAVRSASVNRPLPVCAPSIWIQRSTRQPAGEPPMLEPGLKQTASSKTMVPVAEAEGFDEVKPIANDFSAARAGCGRVAAAIAHAASALRIPKRFIVAPEVCVLAHIGTGLSKL